MRNGAFRMQKKLVTVYSQLVIIDILYNIETSLYETNDSNMYHHRHVIEDWSAVASHCVRLERNEAAGHNNGSQRSPNAYRIV